MEFLVNHLNELSEVARSIISHCGSQRIYLFYGDMGAGKTTLISELCQCLGVKGETSSPTFSLVNDYEGETLIHHMDLYRIETEKEAIDAGIEALIFEQEEICFIEWPQIIESWFDKNFVKVIIEECANNARLIRIEIQ